MAIQFISFIKDNYFISKWSGIHTDSDAIKLYKKFYNSHEWKPGMNELSDLSEFDFTSITSQGLINMANYVQTVYEKYNINNAKTAVFCPRDIQSGMTRAYKTWADESPETVMMFKDINAAKEWLISNRN